jgi:hypothetical protein
MWHCRTLMIDCTQTCLPTAAGCYAAQVTEPQGLPDAAYASTVPQVNNSVTQLHWIEATEHQTETYDVLDAGDLGNNLCKGT